MWKLKEPEKLEFSVNFLEFLKMLQKDILKKQNVANQSEIEKFQQYGRWQCLRFEDVSIEKN